MFLRDVKQNFTLRVSLSFSISILFVGCFAFFFWLVPPIMSLFGLADMQIALTKGLTELKWTMFGVFYLSFPLTYMYYTFISEKSLSAIEEKEIEEEREQWRMEHDPKYKLDKLMENL